MIRRTTRETEMIRGARCRLQLSQQQVAAFIGVQIRQYQRFEYGETEICRINLRAGLLLCTVLELDPVSLVFGTSADMLPEQVRFLSHRTSRKRRPSGEKGSSKY